MREGLQPAHRLSSVSWTQAAGWWRGSKRPPSWPHQLSRYQRPMGCLTHSANTSGWQGSLTNLANARGRQGSPTSPTNGRGRQGDLSSLANRWVHARGRPGSLLRDVNGRGQPGSLVPLYSPLCPVTLMMMLPALSTPKKWLWLIALGVMPHLVSAGWREPINYLYLCQILYPEYCLTAAYVFGWKFKWFSSSWEFRIKPFIDFYPQWRTISEF